MASFWCISLLSLVQLFAAINSFRLYDGYHLYRVFPSSTAQLTLLEQFSTENAKTDGIQFWTFRPTLGMPSEIFVAPELVQKVRTFLLRNSIPFIVLAHDFGDQMRQAEERTGLDEPEDELANAGEFNLGKYHNYDAIVKYLHLVADANPEIASVSSIGKTSEGRELAIIKLGYPSSTNASKPALLLDAGIHAREWIAPAVALHFVNALVHNPKFHELLRKIDVHVIPVLNPDGYIHSWTKDRLWRRTRSGPRKVDPEVCGGESTVSRFCYGVDPNRNFPFHWDESGTSKCPCSQIYSGEKPLVEPECAHLAEFIGANKAHVKAYLTLHSYGNLIIHGWNYAPNTYPEGVGELRRVANAMVKAITGAGGAEYTVGSAPDILYSAAGGSDDYAQSEGIKYVYTMELTSGAHGSTFGGFIFPEQGIKAEAEKILPGIRVLAQQVADDK